MDFEKLQKWTLKYLIMDIDCNINQYWFEAVDYKTGN